MPKNPVFEFLKQQQGPSPKSPVGRIPILGQSNTQAASRQSTVYARPFSYRAGTLNADAAIVENILANPHPTDVFADSSFFSPSRMDLLRQLLIAKTITITSEVRQELADLENQTANPLNEVLFPGGQLNPRIEVLSYKKFKKYAYVVSRYANLLHLRKRVLDGPFKAYLTNTSVPPKGKEREKIVQSLLKRGFSWRTVKLATKDSKTGERDQQGPKGNPNRIFTDEALVVCGVLSPIVSGRDCFILTADRDVFDQFYQFTVLLHDDYGSFLIGNDYRMNPQNYPHVHRWATDYMHPGAVAVGRVLEPESLVPLIYRTCATWVVDVHSRETMSWVALQEVRKALKFQERARDCRVGDGGDGTNVHISLGDPQCKVTPMHFTVGEDHIAFDMPSAVGNIRLSRFDIFRAVTDFLSHRKKTRHDTKGAEDR